MFFCGLLEEVRVCFVLVWFVLACFVVLVGLFVHFGVPKWLADVLSTVMVSAVCLLEGGLFSDLLWFSTYLVFIYNKLMVSVLLSGGLWGFCITM